jgi:hypothetical protein
MKIPGLSPLKVQTFHILLNFWLRRWERSVYRMRSTLTRNVNELDPQNRSTPAILETSHKWIAIRISSEFYICPVRKGLLFCPGGYMTWIEPIFLAWDYFVLRQVSWTWPKMDKDPQREVNDGLIHLCFMKNGEIYRKTLQWSTQMCFCWKFKPLGFLKNFFFIANSMKRFIISHC